MSAYDSWKLQSPERYDDPPEPRPGTCRCGSGEIPYWVNDAKGIPLAKVCIMCEEKELKKFRPEILTGYDQSDVDEPIEPEE